MLEPYRTYLTNDVRFDDAAATRLLSRCGMERPTLSTETIHRLVDLAFATEDVRPEPAPVSTA
jgi:hypothetical protein